MLQLRDARTGEVTPVVPARAGALRVHACGSDLRSLLVADLVRRAATLSHDLVVRVTATGTHPDAPAFNIHPAEVVGGEPAADVLIGCSAGDALLVEVGASNVSRPGGDHDPLAARLALLEIDYRKPVELDDATITTAGLSLARWRTSVASWAQSPGAPMHKETARTIATAFDNDLETPLALQALLTLETAEPVAPGTKFETFAYADRFFGLDLARDIR